MSQLSSPSPLDRILELKDEVEKQKVEITPEVRAYIQSHLDIVQGKLSKCEAVTEDDMKFIDEVRLWVAMPEGWRAKHPSIGSMKMNDRIMKSQKEAQKRNISLHQWFDLLHLTDANDEPQEWIDEMFQFPGNYNIVSICDLFLDSRPITHFPENLKVRGSVGLVACKFLDHLPGNFELEGTLSLTSCISLRLLPDHLKVGRNLKLENCTALTRLPGDLEVGADLILSDNLQDNVKEDAARLKQEGKIKGKIEYR